LAKAVTIVCAACGNKNELAPLVLNTTMGHSIRGVGLAPAARGASKLVPVVTLDSAFAGMGGEPRRLILKIDVEGFEPNVIVGAQALLAAGRVALIVWERGPAFADGLGRGAMIGMAALLSDAASAMSCRRPTVTPGRCGRSTRRSTISATCSRSVRRCVTTRSSLPRLPRSPESLKPNPVRRNFCRISPPPGPGYVGG
jgi:Methyltransferase FkbM domain